MERPEKSANAASALAARNNVVADDRRGFFGRVAAIAIGALITLFPFAAGLFVFADPLRRGGAKLGLIRVTSLDAVPADGVPRAFPIVASRNDAWTHFASEPIGAVFLRRMPGQATPEAFQTTCPHAGCMIDYLATDKIFKCPCHNSSFQLDGAIIQPSPSPRPMDKLECKVEDKNGVKEVLVLYENFRTGIAEQVAKE